jgi:heme exporter protein CcmD
MGLYVWGSFAMCAVVLALELGLLALRRRALRRRDRRWC